MRRCVAVASTLAVSAGCASAAAAATGDIGYRDPSYGQLGISATGYKPESKLWFADGWWADMIDPSSARHHMFRLDRASERWVDTGVMLDPRKESHSDILWDASAGKLYVVSHRVPPESMTTLRHPAAADPTVDTPLPVVPQPPPPAPAPEPPAPVDPAPTPAPPAPAPPPPAPAPAPPAPAPPPPPPPPGPPAPPPDTSPPPPSYGPVDAPVSPSPGRLFRYSYDGRSYSLDPGFPVAINTVDTETLVIAKDSTGMLWATWTAGNQVWVNHSLPGDDAHWAAPYVLPGPSTVTPDDISSIIAFGGNKVGLMWSNQVDQHFYFAVHTDGADPGASGWSTSRIPNTLSSDDHINLKADSAGRVYAAVKHSTTGSTDPFLSLLVRSPTGAWSRYTVARVKDGVTRPNVILDEAAGVIHVVYTGPPHANGTGREILEKTSPMSSISFTSGDGTTIMRDTAGANFNDVTTAKQNINAQTGMVVLASDAVANLYWHFDSLAPATLAGRAPFDPSTPTPPPTPPGDTGVSIHIGPGSDSSGGHRAHDDRPGDGRTDHRAVTAASVLDVAGTQRGATVHGRLTVRRARTDVRFVLRARQGHTTRTIVVGSETRARAAVGRLQFAVPLSRRARVALRRYGRLGLTLVVTTRAPGGAHATLTRTVVMRRG